MVESDAEVSGILMATAGTGGSIAINTGGWKRGSGAFRQASPPSPPLPTAQCDITLCDVIAPGCWREKLLDDGDDGDADESRAPVGVLREPSTADYWHGSLYAAVRAIRAI